jgi:hypothetical protein
MTFSGCNQETSAQRAATSRFRSLALVLFLTWVSSASATQLLCDPLKPSSVRVHSQSPRPVSRDPASAISRHKTAPTRETQGPQLSSDSVARPAKVDLKEGVLTVVADNSDLSQILKEVADVSGMRIDGAVGRERVYGVYGPRDPRDVLSDLLTGLGYNFMMVGVTQAGTSRELLLTRQSGGSTSVVIPRPNGVPSDHSDTSDVDVKDPVPIGPGAILHVPPAAPADPEVRVRQNLERLQQMQNRQMQPSLVP